MRKKIQITEADIRVTEGSLESRQIDEIRKDIHDTPEYEGLPLRVLRSNSTVMFDIFVKAFDGFKKVAKKSTVVTDKLIDKLTENKYDTVYTPYEQKNDMYAYVENNLDTIIYDTTVTQEQKSKVIYSTATDIADALFSSPITTGSIQRTRGIIKPMLDSILSDNTTIDSLIAVSSYDYYTYTHSVDVSVYSLGIGRELNLFPTTLNLLGEAAILHDIGKSQIDIGIVNKPGRLTAEEFDEMKLHPTYAYQLLVEHGVKNPAILSGARDHHEKLDGSGYPRGLKGEDISKFARIIAIADIFNALTTRRSYKPALSTFEALKIMKHDMEGELDPDLLKRFIYMMSEKRND